MKTTFRRVFRMRKRSGRAIISSMVFSSGCAFAAAALIIQPLTSSGNRRRIELDEAFSFNCGINSDCGRVSPHLGCNIRRSLFVHRGNLRHRTGRQIFNSTLISLFHYELSSRAKNSPLAQFISPITTFSTISCKYRVLPR